MASDKNIATNHSDSQQSNIEKGFNEGLSDNSTKAGNSKAEQQQKTPSAQSMHKNDNAKDQENSEDTTALHDDEDVEKQ